MGKRMEKTKEITTEVKLTCPKCGFVDDAIMPTDACQFFHECVNCHGRLMPRNGDCCVLCSYGDVPCPPMQLEIES